MPHDSPTAFICNFSEAPFVPLFVKALLRHIGRKTPIDAKYDPNIVQMWSSNNEARRDRTSFSTHQFQMTLTLID